MSQPAIRVEGLSKRYRLGALQQGSRSLKESVGEFLKAPFKKREPVEEFWALDDVSFEIQPGEVVGIVGSNGAGKSTLLKILSRIMKPTKGHVEINGRVGSLLEVGTGFHPELTGRENIYLNGSFLGMSHQEIEKKFDEIVAFAEIEKFLDTPVKRYSSGMYVRLAFAVAAHLEPEILIIDEVLAVGDSSFQQKCLGKIGDAAKRGRTILFVSHNLQAVTLLCSHAILMSKGRVSASGPSRTVVQTYLESNVRQQAEVHWEAESAPGNHLGRFRAIRILDESGVPRSDFDIAQPIDVELEFRVLQGGSKFDSSIHVFNEDLQCIFAVSVALRDGLDGNTEPGLYRTTCRIPKNFLNDGRHFVSAFLVRNSSDVFVNLPQVATFRTYDYGTSRGEFLGKQVGIIRPILPWNVKRIEELS